MTVHTFSTCPGTKACRLTAVLVAIRAVLEAASRYLALFQLPRFIGLQKHKLAYRNKVVQCMGRSLHEHDFQGQASQGDHQSRIGEKLLRRRKEMVFPCKFPKYRPSLVSTTDVTD